MTTVLLDTNVLIALEDGDRNLELRFAEMLRNLPKAVEFYYHPIQLEDIGRDKDVKRRERFASRIARYKSIQSPPEFDNDYFRKHGWSTSSDNDIVDNNLLACVLEPVIDYLITNDKRILSKAKRSGISEQVMSLEDFAALINQRASSPELACVQELPCHKLDARDSFFDSLRASYPGFDSWLSKCARQQRKCWAIVKDGGIRALCIFKEETAETIDDHGFRPEGRVLKLCTFKVDADARGSKMGERLLHMAFSYALAHDVNFMYLTVKEEEHERLLALLETFGFMRHGLTGDADRVFGKYLRPQPNEGDKISKADYIERYYPSYKDDESVKKYLVPIQRGYHEKLFPDIADFRYSLFGDVPEMYGSESNTIRKAYLCRSPIKSIEKGDILLFYRSGDRQCVDALGVVREVLRSADRKQIFEMVKGRTVYTFWEIDEMVDHGEREVLVICFDLVSYLDKPLHLRKLREMGLSHPQSIYELSEGGYRVIMEASA